MNSVLIVGKQTRRVAGVAAIVATVFTMGGTATLAHHYAYTNVDGRDLIARNGVVHQAAPAVRDQIRNARVVVASKKLG